MGEKTKDLVFDVLYMYDENKLLPESDKTGNIEYKRRLDKKDFEKLKNMTSQLLWRMNEGKRLYGVSEAHYIIGINDDGTFPDNDDIITNDILNSSIDIFHHVVKKAKSKIINERIYVFKNNKMIVHITVRRNAEAKTINESNVLIMGIPDAGKTSLLGKLTYGQNDDGNGFSRQLVLRHQHEKNSGESSSLKFDTIGFTDNNILVNYSSSFDSNMDHIFNTSDRLINLFDVPGNIKYSKTIFHTISTNIPNQIIICIPSIMSTTHNMINNIMYDFIVSVCVTYNIKPIIVCTKIDCCDKRDYHSVEAIIKHELNQIHDKLTQLSKSNYFDTCVYIPISNITNEGYDSLINTLSNISSEQNKPNDRIFDTKFNTKFNTKFIINDVFVVPDFGQIIHGYVKKGVINIDDDVRILCRGSIFTAKIKTIQRKMLDVDTLQAGETGSVTLYYSSFNKIDKTSIIFTSDFDDNDIFHDKVYNFIPIYQYHHNLIKSQQYIMFVENLIIPVFVTSHQDNHFTLTIIASKVMIESDIAILKDDNNNFFMIRFE